MYVVKTYLDKSSIHGIGVFAGEDIKKGTVVWEFIEGFDKVFTPDQIESFPDKVRQHLDWYSYQWNGKTFLCSGYGQFTNHADDPNTRPNWNNMIDIASRDINKGEEITTDYREIDEISRDNLASVLYRDFDALKKRQAND